MKTGIAIITYNRKERLLTTLRAVQDTAPRNPLIIADDGSPDNTHETLKDLGVQVIGKKNLGVVGNKNRALFFLFNQMECDVAILLEDDTFPQEKGWAEAWSEAAWKHGHINLAGVWFRNRVIAGDGTPSCPFVSQVTSGQCAAFSRKAISYVGYMDSRFRGYGHGHVEHSTRMARAGFGGYMSRIEDGRSVPNFFLLSSPLRVFPYETHNKDAEQVEANRKLLERLKEEGVYRAPWRTDAEMFAFKKEMEE